MKTVKLQLEDAGGNKCGVRKFAVEDMEPVVDDGYYSNTDIPGQSDQRYSLAVYQRIDGRGYVALIDASGQWSNRGDHGSYVGTGSTAEAALSDAWDRDDDVYGDESSPPQCLVSACVEYDQTVTEPEVE